MQKNPESLLRDRKLRITPSRKRILKALLDCKRPLSADAVYQSLSGTDLVTVYRTLQLFAKVGIAREVHLKDAITRYELQRHGHHHHLVCNGCGIIGELPECRIKVLEEDVLASFRTFASIEEHVLEFFGTCRECASA